LVFVFLFSRAQVIPRSVICDKPTLEARIHYGSEIKADLRGMKAAKSGMKSFKHQTSALTISIWSFPEA